MEAPLSASVRATTAREFVRYPSSPRNSIPCGIALAAALLLGACGQPGNGPSEMRAAQTYKPVGRAVRWNATDAQRFGISAGDFAKAKTPGGTSEEGGLHWTMPAGWSALPAAQFRNPNFQVGADERAQCYLTTLAGTGGGLEGNVNRWRQQVSLPPLDAAAIAALPQVDWLGGKATFVDFTGEWQGMSGDEAEQGWRLVGLIQIGQEESQFLKMIGPANVIGTQVEAFLALAASFHGGEGHSHEGESAPAPVQVGTTPAKNGSLPPDHPPMPGQTTTKPATGEMPAGHPPIGAASGGAVAEGPDTMRSEMLTWKAPAGWKRGQPKPMRETTYFAGEAECWVTLLPGDGGGLLANINRWCTQMGAQPLVDADLAALERVPMHGAEGVIVRIARGGNATAATGQEALLGAVCMLEGRSLFVKMTGTAGAVDAQRAAFAEFCRSLQPVQ